MAEVTIYKYAEETVAKHPGVGAALDAKAEQLAVRARANLADKARHPYSRGYSYITVGRDRVNRAVILNDPDPNTKSDGTPRGPAEWAIEMGAIILRSAVGG